MTRSKKRRPSDIDPGDQGNLYPQKKNRGGTYLPFRPCPRLESNTPRSSRESKDHNNSGSSYDSHSRQKGLVDSYRPRPRSKSRSHPTRDSYRPDSSRFATSRAATNEPVTSRTEDSVRSRGRSWTRRFHQQEALDEPSPGGVTRRPDPDRSYRNGIPYDTRSLSPRSRDRNYRPAGSPRFRENNSRSPLHAGKRIAIEVRNRPSGNSTRAPNPPESLWIPSKDFSKLSLAKDSPTLLPESRDRSQPTKELSSLGGNNSVTASPGSQPDTNAPEPRREESSEDTRYSSDSGSLSHHSVYGLREGSSTRLGKSRLPLFFRYEIPIPKLEPEDFLPESTSPDRGIYLKAGTSSEICVWRPDSAPNPAPNDSNWRTRDFTPPIRELVYGRARQAKNRASAARLPDNVPLFKPRIRASRSGHLRSRKAKFRGTLAEYHQMLSDKKNQVRDDDTTFPKDSREDDSYLSSSSEEEDYDVTSRNNSWMFPQPKPQWGTAPESKIQTKSKNGPLTNEALCAGGTSKSTYNTPRIEAKNGPPLTTAQPENAPKSKPQVGSENGPVTKDTLGAGTASNSSTHSIAPIKKLAIARGKQLRPELVQAMALFRASASKSVDLERERGGGHLALASEGPPATSPEISGCTSEKEGVLHPPNK